MVTSLGSFGPRLVFSFVSLRAVAKYPAVKLEKSDRRLSHRAMIII